MIRHYYFLPGSTRPFFYQAAMPLPVIPSVYQHQDPSTNGEGHNVHWGPEHEQALIHYANQTNAGDTSNAGTVADAQADVLRCMLSTAVSPFGEHILPCGEGFADLDELMNHIRDRHGLRGPDNMRLDCVWLTNGVHLCGENIRKSGHKRHIATHLGLKVACHHHRCGKEYSRIDTLRKHLKEHHGESINQSIL